MPILYILAGPNGAGKTTFYFTAIEQGFIDKNLSFINTDLITRNELGGYSEENFAKAEDIVRSRLADHISKNANFLIESNLAKQSDHDWLRLIKEKGYDIILYFLCTSNIEINIARVKKRVKEGGHDVPENIITDRYRMALVYLRKEIFNFQEVYLIENSTETAEQVALIKNGKLINKKEDCPEWVNNVLFLIEKLKNKRT
jgi:predicted ABC-type ATPase